MDSNLDRVKNGELFFSDLSTNGLQSGIMQIVTVIIILLNLAIVARMMYLGIQMMQGDENGQLKNQIKNCIIALIIVNVICTLPFANAFINYYVS